jgi:hypothetical protein
MMASNITVKTLISNSKRINLRTFTAITGNRLTSKLIGSIVRPKVWKHCLLCQFSDEASKPIGSAAASTDQLPIILYKGEYAGRLQWLRRVSLLSSIFCATVLPSGIVMGVGSMSFAGQVSIVSTAILMSLSSTLFLQLITNPYTVALKEIPQLSIQQDKLENKLVDKIEAEIAEKGVFDGRVFRATKINVFGQLIETEFTMKDAVKPTSGKHPFASVRIRGENFYIFGGDLSEIPLRHALSSEA